MRYLFFDIEYANCFDKTGKICEFGYVIIGENFEVQEKKEIIINPAADFDEYALNHLLSYTKEEYEQAETFPTFFDEIKEVITAANQIIIGQNTKGDMKVLEDESLRYNLDVMHARFYDIGAIFKKMEDLPSILSVEKMLAHLEISLDLPLHKALTDAWATVLIIKGLATKHKLTINEILEQYGVLYKFAGSNKNEVKSYREEFSNTIGDILKAKGIVLSG